MDEVGVGELNDGGDAVLGVLGEEEGVPEPAGDRAAAVSAADAAPDHTPRTSGVSGPGQAA